MSWSREITIWCDADECDAWSQESGMTVGEMRRYLGPEGWVNIRGRDLCPAHRPSTRRFPRHVPLPNGVELLTPREVVERSRNAEGS